MAVSGLPLPELPIHTASMNVARRAARGSLLASAFLLVICAGPSSTGAPAMVLFESHVGKRALEIESTMMALRAMLASGDILVDPQALIGWTNEVLPWSGHWDRDEDLIGLTTQLDAGVSSYLNGDFKLAALQLDAALQAVHRNATLVVADPKSRTWMTKALTSLALARLQLRDRTGALAAMSEQIRSFPELPVTRADFGTRGESLYNQARRSMEAGARGALLVDVNQPDARIYINEFGRGRGGTFTSDLFPGSYRILVVVGGEDRLYRISIHPNEQTRLSIDWAFDTAFVSSTDWMGLEIPTELGPAQQELGRLLAKRIAFSDVIIVGISSGYQEKILWGVVYEKGSGRELRSGKVILTPTSMEHHLPIFARFLASGENAFEIKILTKAADRSIDAQAAALLPAPMPSTSDWPTWMFVGVGIASAGTGTYLAVAGGNCADDPVDCGPLPYNKVWAYSLIGGGIASVGIAALLHFTSEPSSSVVPAAVVLRRSHSGGFASLSWQF